MIRKCLAFIIFSTTAFLHAPAFGSAAVTYESQILRPSDGNTPDQFGNSLAIDRNSALIGAYGDNGRGSVYYYTKDATDVWHEAGKFTTTGLTTNAGFGQDVGLYGDFAIVGAFQQNSLSGRAYLYKRVLGSWNQVATLAPTVSGTPRFGNAVDIGKNTAVVGSPYFTTAIPSGAVQVYSRNASQQWLPSATLIPSDGATSDEFGFDLQLRGDRLIIGAPQDDNMGSAYIFDRAANGSWTQAAKLTPSDGQIYDGFGRTVALGDGVAIAGVNRFGAGGAYLFKETSPGNWEQFAKLASSDMQDGDRFGSSVSIWNNYALVGAQSSSQVGAAYLFQFNLDGTWSQIAKFAASDGQVEDYFARITALGDGSLLIGAEANSALGYGAGAVYSYAFVPEPASSYLASTVAFALFLRRRSQRLRA